MAKLTFYSKVSGNEAELLTGALKVFAQSDDPTVIISNRDLSKLLGDAAGGDIDVVLKEFSTKVLSESAVVEDQAYESFAVYHLVEKIGWKDSTLFVHFSTSARRFLDEWRKYYLSKIGASVAWVGK